MHPRTLWLCLESPTNMFTPGVIYPGVPDDDNGCRASRLLEITTNQGQTKALSLDDPRVMVGMGMGDAPPAFARFREIKGKEDIEDKILYRLGFGLGYRAADKLHKTRVVSRLATPGYHPLPSPRYADMVWAVVGHYPKNLQTPLDLNAGAWRGWVEYCFDHYGRMAPV